MVPEELRLTDFGFFFEAYTESKRLTGFVWFVVWVNLLIPGHILASLGLFGFSRSPLQTLAPPSGIARNKQMISH
jgi:hypothetical protein